MPVILIYGNYYFTLLSEWFSFTQRHKDSTKDTKVFYIYFTLTYVKSNAYQKRHCERPQGAWQSSGLRSSNVGLPRRRCLLAMTYPNNLKILVSFVESLCLCVNDFINFSIHK